MTNIIKALIRHEPLCYHDFMLLLSDMRYYGAKVRKFKGCICMMSKDRISCYLRVSYILCLILHSFATAYRSVAFIIVMPNEVVLNSTGQSSIKGVNFHPLPVKFHGCAIDSVWSLAARH